MSKKIKYIYLILILLSFGTSVNAASIFNEGEKPGTNKCFTTPGGSVTNKVTIPQNYNGVCYYELNVTKSGTIKKHQNGAYTTYNIEGGLYHTNDSFKSIYLVYRKYADTKVTKDYFDVIELYADPFTEFDINSSKFGSHHLITFKMYPNASEIEAYTMVETKVNDNYTNLNGLYLSGDTLFSADNDYGSIKYESTGNCPKSLYWVSRNITGQNSDFPTSAETGLFRFTDNTVVSEDDRENNIGATVGFYELAYDKAVTKNGTNVTPVTYIDEEGLYIVPDDSVSSSLKLDPAFIYLDEEADSIDRNPMLIYNVNDTEDVYYKDYITNNPGCPGGVLRPNQNKGHDPKVEEEVTKITEQTLDCKYFFEEHKHDNVYACYDITMSYSITELKNNKTGEIKTVFSSSNNHGSVGWYLNDIKFYDTNGNFIPGRVKDFLVQDPTTKKYKCADKKIYAYLDQNQKWAIMGETDYKEGNCRVFVGCDEEQIIESKAGPTGECYEIPIDTPKPTPSGGNGGYIDFDNPVDVNCNGILGDLLPFIKKIFKWIQIIAPIFVVIISSAEFAGSLLQDDKDALKKASNRFMKRLIIAVALFFIPMILSFVFDIFNSVAGRFVDTCI